MEKKKKLVIVLMTSCTISVLFATLLLNIAMVQSITDPPADCIWVEPLFTDNLQKCDTFTVDVMVNITNLYGYEYHLKWNSTVIDAVGITYHIPPGWNPMVVKNDTDHYPNCTSYHWLGIAAMTPSTPFTGVTSLCTYSFHVEYQPYEPEPCFVGTLDIYDDMFADEMASPISHDTHDGEYRIPSLCDDLFDRALSVVEDSSANPCHRKTMIGAAINYWLQDWGGVLPNETIPETVEIYDNFRERGDRLLEKLGPIHTEPRPTGPDPDEVPQRKELMDVVVIAVIFIENVIDIVNINIAGASASPWLVVWNPYVSYTPEELVLSGYVTRSSAFVVVKEVKGIAYEVGDEWIPSWGGHLHTRIIDFYYAEFIKTIIYEYVYDPVNQTWNIQQTVDMQLVNEDKLENFWWFFPAAKDP
jgi:hypothetical protein